MYLHIVLHEGKAVFLNALRTSFDLYKIMVPFLILTRLLEESGVVNWFGSLLEPLMGIVGLPGNMGLVWATSLILGTYGALLVFVTFIASTPLTIAQTTILLTMCLIAHSLPIEAMIARKAGLRIGFQILLRIGGAILYGIILHIIYRTSDALQETVRIIAPISVPESSLLGWAKAQVQNLLSIFLIILGVMALLRMLEMLGITALITRFLGPALRYLGIGEPAIPITIVGILLGLSFGGGLIIQEAKSGKIPPYDMFFSLALMCILHSIIEDTVTMFVFGADLSGLFWGRLAFTFVSIFLLAKAIRLIPKSIFYRYFFTPAS